MQSSGLPRDVEMVLDLAGVQIEVCSKLRGAAVLSLNHGVVFVASDLSEEELRDVADRVLAACAAALEVAV